MTKDGAKRISELMLAFGAKLDESLGRIKQEESEEEFKRYRTAVSKLMTTMLLEVMNPLYAEHPDLKPRELT